jgi:CheY-like chemotaxis protein
MKILVVEDEPLIRLGLVSVLEEAGFIVLDAPHADGAIRLLEADSSIRMVVTDVDMPGSMDGIKLAHYVRQKWPPIKLVVISGKIGVRAGELPSGAHFMGKPYQEAALVGLLQSMISAEGDQA